MGEAAMADILRACGARFVATVLLAVLMAASGNVAPDRAAAQDYPNRFIKAIMPLGPGGVGDVFLRAVAAEMSKGLGQSIVVENRPGGAALIGTQACAQAAPDGYTICLLPIDSMSIAPFFYKSIPFDPDKDFVPIVRFFFIVEAFMVHPSLNVSSVAELIALSKAKPGTLSYATQANALTLFMEGFKKDTGADLQRVPFQSGGEALNAVLGGHVPVGYFGLANLLQQARAGRVKVLAVDTPQRSPLYPSAPTLAEAGYTGIPIRPWWGLFAPAATPKLEVDKLQAEAQRVMRDAAFVERHMTSIGLEPAATTPEEFARFLKEDRALAKRLVETSGFRQE
jgi:tripartite-type tricarboxylate transporter receptor subunit TctC